jgi:tRNA A-37 threonylcarbamoyl transferase component Bud32/tetratricopeptide (TPR) repeat protein
MSELPAVPFSLGHYRVLSPLGAGGMGEVYLATDTRLNRSVAIKVLPARSAADAEAHQRIFREARLIATIDHPNVCTIYEIGEDADQPFIVMQYVEGETLGQRLRRTRATLAETIEIGRQITAALAEAHKRGIVHRDIKPANIMINASGVVKVLDFGLAKSFMRTANDATEVFVSRADVVSGTTPYMSPEQLLGESLDGRSDLFSLGVVLYEVATGGRRPFDGKTPAATINAILMSEPEPLTQDDLPALQPLIQRALAKALGKRFADASAMHEALTALGEGRSAPVRRAPAVTMRKRRKKGAATDPAAEKLYLRGRTQWNKRHPDALRQAIALFQEAVEIDPMHAGSYAGLADAYMLLGFVQVISPRDVMPKAKAAALRAIELDPNLAEPHASLGYLAGVFEWDWPTAQRELMTAMKLNPEYAWAPHWYGVLAAHRSLEESLQYVTRAHEIDPLSPIIHTAIGMPHHWWRDYPAALRLYRQVLDTEAAFAPAHYYIALTYEQMKDYGNAIHNFTRAAEISNGGGLFLGALGHCAGISGDHQLARKMLHDLEERARERYVSPFNVMLVHLGLGEIDLALDWLERALEDRTGGLLQSNVEPRFDVIRNEPRFIELLTRYGLHEMSDVTRRSS